MKKIGAIILVLLSFAHLYDTVSILIGTFLPPYSIRPFGEVNTNTYLIYKITSAFVMLFVAFKIFNPEKDDQEQ